MPQLITYSGRPVKRRRRVSNGLQLTFYAAAPGEPGPRLTVSEADWKLHGSIEHFGAGQRPDVRKLGTTELR